MCYILYGAVNSDIDKNDLQRLCSGSEFTFRPGTKHDIKMCIRDDTADYRVTDWVCDCDFPFGFGNPSADELIKLAKLISSLRDAKNSKCIYISKTWEGQRNKREETIELNNIDIIDFLANAKENCLYTVNLN